MVKSIERTTLLLPLVVVTACVIAVMFASRAPSHDTTPAAQAVLAQISADSEHAPLDAASLHAIAATLANVPDVGAVTVDGKIAAGSRATATVSQVCATVRTTRGPVALCAEMRPHVESMRQANAIAAGAVIAALLAGILITIIMRRSLIAIARTVDDRVASKASGSLGVLSESVNRLLNEAQEHEVTLRRRSLELESANKELEAFTFSASHDLRAPLASIEGFTQMLLEDFGRGLDENGRECVKWIRDASLQMQDLVTGLLQMSRYSRADLEVENVDLSRLAHSVADGLRQRQPDRDVAIRIQDGIVVDGDPHLLRAVLENLMSNAWKFTSKREHATIEVGVTQQNGHSAIYVRDDGAGFDPAYADKMFRAFQRLHSRQDFEGTGIGLATVQRILHRHGGKIWAEGEVEKGATFYFTTGPHDSRALAPH